MAESFGERLRERILERGNLCVGIDPSAAQLSHWDRGDDSDAAEYFARTVLDAVAEAAVAIKPQIAYFERFGAAGYRVLERLLADARASDILIIADAKRGDIGSTNEGYAAAWLDDRSPLASDAVTVSPYTGVAALQPFFHYVPQGKGVFILAATSNPEGRFVQSARTASGDPVESRILREIAAMNALTDGLGGVGAVWGATRDVGDFDLTQLQGPYLVPGVGAQGATAEDASRLFVGCPKGSVLVNVSRGISHHGPTKQTLRDVARHTRDELLSAFA